MKRIEDLKELYKIAVELYVDELCKNDCYFEYWIADKIGEIAVISDMSLHFNDIKYCVDNKIDFEWLQHWYYYNLDNAEKNIDKYINLSSYCSLRKNQDLTDLHFTEILNRFLKIKDIK